MILYQYEKRQYFPLYVSWNACIWKCVYEIIRIKLEVSSLLMLSFSSSHSFGAEYWFNKNAHHARKPFIEKEIQCRINGGFSLTDTSVADHTLRTQTLLLPKTLIAFYSRVQTYWSPCSTNECNAKAPVLYASFLYVFTRYHFNDMTTVFAQWLQQ